jgi:hypothetical protein
LHAAIIIGCGTFDDPEVASLRFAGADADRFANVAEQVIGIPTENIYIAADTNRDRARTPTRSEVIRTLAVGKKTSRNRFGFTNFLFQRSRFSFRLR